MNNKREELVRITIDLGPGKAPESIVVYRGQEDHSRALANEFC